MTNLDFKNIIFNNYYCLYYFIYINYHKLYIYCVIFNILNFYDIEKDSQYIFLNTGKYIFNIIMILIY